MNTCAPSLDDRLTTGSENPGPQRYVWFAILVAMLPAVGLISISQSAVRPATAPIAAAPVAVADYDVLIKSGTVYLGDGSAPLDVDLGIIGDQITFLGRSDSARAAKIIDARGLAVAPGFINMLSWSTESLIADGRSQGEIRQGVTTQIFGEGQSMGPLNPAMKRRRVQQQQLIKFSYDWEMLSEYLQWLERRGISQNVASFIGAGTVRERVIGLSPRAATPAEIGQMQLLVEQEMQAGALGIGSALVYPPGSHATTDELIALCRVAARYGGMYISHLRNQSDELAESVEELIRISRDAGIPAEIYHFGAAGESNWDKTDTVIQRIEQARDAGLRITANMHTYTAGCTGLTACLPPWSQAGGPDAMFKRLQDPALRRRIALEIQGDGKGWDNPYRTVGTPERIVPMHFENPRLKPYEGRSLAEIATARRQRPVEAIMDLILEDRSRIETVYFVDSEENVRKQIRLPWVSFGSDAGSISIDGVFRGQGTHPRAFGNFARLLGKYVRDEQLLPLVQAIHRLTGLPAANLGLDRRGLLREGYFADIAIFDPRTIADRATFEQPMQYAVGVKHVFVNGVQVLADGNHTGALPGRALRRGRTAADPNPPPTRPSDRGELVPEGRQPVAWGESSRSLGALPFASPERATQAGSDSSGAPTGLWRYGTPENLGLSPQATDCRRDAAANRYPRPVSLDVLSLVGLIGPVPVQSEDSFRAAREQMVRESLEKAEPPIKNARVLDSMRKTPRHQFVAAQYRKYAYVDTILPIGYQQTISPPFIVAYMTEKIDPQPDDRVLEIGTGSGYQAAVLAPLVHEVYTIEIVEPLGRKAADVLKRLNYANVFVKVGDGYKGWPEHAPFDKIIVTCSPDHVPQPLVDQLKEGGMMIIPVGERYQQSFYLVQKRDGKLAQEKLLGTFFVPMTGEAERQRRDNPDGTKPSITNGDFEAGSDAEGGPEFWYYQRGVTLEDRNAPEGNRYVAYSNDEPGHLSHSNQGFAVDGRRVEALELSFWVKTDKVRAGSKAEQVPGIVITFIDPGKKIADTVRVGPFEGTTDWTEKRERVSVPKSAEYAVIMIGLNGGTGRIAFDNVQIRPIPRGTK